MKRFLIGRAIIKRYTKKDVSESFMERMDEFIIKSIAQADGRAEANGRRTLMGRDI